MEQVAKKQSANNYLPLGSIVANALAKEHIPAGWLPCDGSEIPGEYQELATLLGCNYTPDLTGKTLIGAGGSYSLGQTGGEARHTLTEDEIPPHHHEYEQMFLEGTHGGFTAHETGIKSHGLRQTTAAGGGKPHNNMQPYRVVYYIIYAISS